VIVDTSAIIAILLREPPAEDLELALATSPANYMSASTYVELVAVASQHMQPATLERALRLVTTYEVEIVPFDQAQAKCAADAYRTFGRSSGHPARLNLGDCFSYALAATLDEPLLFVGGDFAHTDIRPAIS